MTCELDKRSAAEVSLTSNPEGPEARKDSAAYVSLSSYSLVKEHDGKNPSFGRPVFTK